MSDLWISRMATENSPSFEYVQKFTNMRGLECVCRFDGNPILFSILWSCGIWRLLVLYLRTFARTSGLVHSLSYLVGIYSVRNTTAVACSHRLSPISWPCLAQVSRDLFEGTIHTLSPEVISDLMLTVSQMSVQGIRRLVSWHWCSCL